MKVAAALAFAALDWGGRARLGFASGLRARSCSACDAHKGRRGADGCNNFERALGHS